MNTGSRAVYGNALLKLLTKRISRKKYLGHVVNFFREWSGCRCVGVRVLNEDGTIPYEYCIGFSEEFLKSENWLSTKEDQCACTRVILGKPDPSDTHVMTPFGTFFSEDCVSLLRQLHEENGKKFRGKCQKHGFKTIAVIPVRCGPDIVAAIHLADERESLFSDKTIDELESVTPLIGEAIYRFGVEDRLRKNYAMQRVVNSLMRMSLGDVGLEEILRKALDKILSMPWLAFEAKGCIFLVREGMDMLELIAHKGVSKPLLKKCAEIHFGQCSCGKAAADKNAVLSTKEMPELEQDADHLHYCMPLIGADSVLGVAKFFLKKGQQLNPQHKEFLSTISNALSGIIMRKKAEEKLKDSSERLRLLATHMQLANEDERTEFAREVHDELGQALTKLKMDIFWVRKRLPKDASALIEKSDESLALIDSTISSVRRICMELRPDILDHLGIIAAIEWQIQEVGKRTGINFDISIEPRDIKISKGLAITLFRILQEALTNIIRHAEATDVTFNLETANDILLMRISDNGKGIARKHIQSAKSFGIMGIRERVRSWNGTLRIDGVPGKGTTIEIIVPLSIIPES